MRYYKFKINPLICCWGPGEGPGGSLGGASSDGGMGGAGSFGGNTGDGANGLGSDADFMGINAEVDPNESSQYGDQTFSGWLTDKINNFFTAENLSKTFAGSMIPMFGLGIMGMDAIAGLAAMAGITVGEGDTTVGDQAGPGESKDFYSWLQDPDFIKTVEENYPELDIVNLSAELKADTDYLIASLYLGERPSSGQEAYDYDQMVTATIQDWNNGDRKDETNPQWVSEYVTEGKIPEFLTEVLEVDTIDIGGKNVKNDDFKGYFDTATPDTVKADMTTLGVDNEGLKNAVNTAYETEYTPEDVTAFLDQDKSYTDYITKRISTPTFSEGATLDFGNGLLMQEEKGIKTGNGLLQGGR